MRDAKGMIMRTTLAIDDDVLAAARGIAVRDKKSVGEIVSDLARKGLAPTTGDKGWATRNGVPLIPIRDGAGVATLELVKQLMDEDG